MTDRKRRPYDVVKRVVDVGVSGVLLILLLPVQAIIAVLVLADVGRPVLFRQPRPGRDGRIFRLAKFRTMREAHGQGGLSSDAERLTRFGRVLRSTSLDELPSLWNVLAGDMSLVGPRPLLVEYLPRYSARQARRHEVRPGITGLAQVSGRNALSWTEKFELDVYYVDHRSFRLDAAILVRTVTSVLRRDGISAEGSATMHEFMGDDPAAESSR